MLIHFSLLQNFAGISQRAGRIEEQIEMLQLKLKHIEDGIAFGGKKTKIARSQGKKVHMTVDQERSRCVLLSSLHPSLPPSLLLRNRLLDSLIYDIGC